MPTSRDNIPANDAEFEAWAGNFVSVLSAQVDALGLTANDAQAISDARTEFRAALTDYIARKAAALSASQTRKMKRKALEAIIRPTIRRITNHPGMTNDLRKLLGLRALSGVRVRNRAGYDIPVMMLESKPGLVIIHFGTSPGNELLNGKPDWAKGCNIYRRKADESAFSLIAFDTASPYYDAIRGPATDVTYRVAYRGTKENAIGPACLDQTIPAGG